jgi:hypothetical protein
VTTELPTDISSWRRKLLLCCKYVLALPFVVLMLAAIYLLIGSNLVVLFADKPVVAHLVH